MSQLYPPVYLKAREDKRIRAGHLWIYNNEIDSKRSPLNTFTPGQLVTILNGGGHFLGIGTMNPHTLMSIRVLTRIDETIDEAWFSAKLTQSLNWRTRCYDKPYYRLVFSEGDRLPGLVIDRFDNTLVLQCNSKGIDLCLPDILNALEKLIQPKRIILKNDSPTRELEGLESYVKVLTGSDTEDLSIEENHCQFKAPVDGQKTGWFYDHRENRKALLPLVKDKKVLDLFSYCGAWGIAALNAGAKSADLVDASAKALSYCEQNAEANQCMGKVSMHKGDAFEFLSAAPEQHYDVVIVDPPALIKRKKDYDAGLSAYQKLNALAFRCLKPQGILVSASCSYALDEAAHQSAVRQAALKQQRETRIIAYGYHAWDHPIHPAIPETNYLSTLFCVS